MESKKKDVSLDHKSKKTLKELLKSQKRQLNVVLSREMFPLDAPILFIAKKNPDNSQSVILNEDSDSKGGSVSDKDNKEVIIYEPETSLQTVNLNQKRDITPVKQSSKSNPTLQPSPSNDKRETYKYPIKYFRRLIRNANEQAIIQLSIDNPDVRNFRDDSVKDIINDEEDSEPISKLICKPDICITKTTNLTKKREEIQSRKSFTEVDQQCGIIVDQNINQNNTGFSDSQIIQNNSPSTSELLTYTNQEKRAKYADKTYTNKTVLEKLLKRKDKTLKKLKADSNPEEDNLILKFQKRGKVKAVKRKIHDETEKNKQCEKLNQPGQKDYLPIWKIKKGPKSFLKNKVQIEPTEDTSHADENKSEQFSSEPNNNGINTLTSNRTENVNQPNKTSTNVNQLQTFEDVFKSTLEMKRRRGRPLKKKLLKNQTEKSYDVSPTKVHQDVTSGTSPVSVPSDTKKNEDEEIKNKVNETNKRNVTEGSEEMGPTMQKNVRVKKSIKLQLQLLRKQIDFMLRSQNRILAILEHSLLDRSELLGKTIRFEGVASF